MKSAIRLLPLLCVYILVVVLAAPNGLAAGDDEARYVQYAENLSHGFYSPEGRSDLWFGPGYPLVLVPFTMAGLPWIAARLLNAVFLYAAAVVFYATLRLYMQERHALIGAYAFGLYLPSWYLVYRLYSEPLALLLLVLMIYFFCRVFRPGQLRPAAYVVLAGLCLAALALTKVFFGFVILAGVVVCGLLFAATRQPVFRTVVVMSAVALAACAPYLIYTYRLTHQVYYWGNSGGLSLYWMSSPYPDDLGDWHSKTDFNSDEYTDDGHTLTVNHSAFFSRVNSMTDLDRDAAFKRQAIRNIREHPVKFLKNWAANVGRLLFNYPYSYTQQKLSTYAYILPNLILLAAVIISLYPTWRARARIPHEILLLLGFDLLVFGGSSVLSAYNRQFLPVVPVIVLWIAFVWTNLARIELRPVAAAADQ
ncbi:MAG TPA: hypothetical protein PKD09_24530 [Aggregatilinea sp.]|uniref:hypothetical protein n=1 Tax=Aggregatilinea sp. TaxID=2806333 RepID=UPI002C0D2AAF|nr:hypothetical protein [Aggregatilinea sp.]HML24844.1 hypothetical protein [Aggregatilinea sp.]